MLNDFIRFNIKNLRFSPSIAILFIIYFFILKLYLPYQFESKSVIKIESSSPIENQNLFQSFVGIQSDNRLSEVLEVIGSYDFFSNSFINKNDAKYLKAYKKYDFKKKLDIFDEKIYNSETNQWLRNETPFKKQIPTKHELWSVFNTKHLKAVLNRESQFVEVKIIHLSPLYSKQVLDRVLEKLDKYFLDIDLKYYQNLNELLKIEISKTENIDVKKMLSDHLSENMQRIASMKAKKYYVINQIEPPYLNEEPFSPKIIFIIFISGFLAILTYLVITLTFYLKATLKRLKL